VGRCVSMSICVGLKCVGTGPIGGELSGTLSTPSSCLSLKGSLLAARGWPAISTPPPDELDIIASRSLSGRSLGVVLVTVSGTCVGVPISSKSAVCAVGLFLLRFRPREDRLRGDLERELGLLLLPVAPPAPITVTGVLMVGWVFDRKRGDGGGAVGCV